MTDRRRKERHPQPAAVPRPTGFHLRGDPSWWLTALLILVHLVFFREVIFGGKSFVSADTLQAATPSHRYAELYRSRHDQWPRWIPHVFCGMPAQGSMMYAAEYPPNRPLRWVLGPAFDPDTAKVFHHILASLGMFLLLRSWGVGRAGALTAGVGFSLATGLVSVTAADHGGKLYTTAYLPIILLVATRLLARPTLAVVSLGGVSVGLMLRAQHPQIAYYGFIAFALFGLCALPGIIRRGYRQVAIVGIGVLALGIIGSLIAAPLALPAAEYAPHSIRGAGPGGGLAYEYATQWSFHPAEIMTLLVPGFFGFGGASYWGHMPFTDAPNYAGILIVALAAMGAVAGIRTTRVRFLLLMGATALLVSMGRHFSPLYNLLFTHLPQFNRFRVPVLILVLLQLSLCALAGMGLDAVLRSTSLFRRRAGVALAAAGIALLLVALASRGVARDARRPGEDRMDPRQVSALQDERASKAAWDGARSAGFLLGAAALILLCGAGSGMRSPRSAMVVIAVAAVVDLWGVSARLVHPQYRKSAVDEYLRPTAAERWLSERVGAEDPFRVLPADSRANSNRFMTFDVSSVLGYYPAKIARYASLMEAGGIQSLNVLQMLNARYVLSQNPLPTSPLLHQISAHGGEILYELAGALPRAWFVSDWRVMDEASTLAAVMDPGFSPAMEAVLEEDPKIAPGGAARVRRIQRPTAERMIIEVEAEGDALLVISEIGYPPGWHAEVDGVAVEVMRANHVVSAVGVPDGARSVVFFYESQAERWGALLSTMGWIVAAALLLGATARSARVRPLARRFGLDRRASTPRG
ncbi:hypothetical protein JXA88_02195 [Candidatus Fermentibacteria bacterium]|nr:hypothetical protein [Candidatus Fermentibacteria bacterium]